MCIIARFSSKKKHVLSDYSINISKMSYDFLNITYTEVSSLKAWWTYGIGQQFHLLFRILYVLFFQVKVFPKILVKSDGLYRR